LGTYLHPLATQPGKGQPWVVGNSLDLSVCVFLRFPNPHYQAKKILPMGNAHPPSPPTAPLTSPNRILASTLAKSNTPFDRPIQGPAHLRMQSGTRYSIQCGPIVVQSQLPHWNPIIKTFHTKIFSVPCLLRQHLFDKSLTNGLAEEDRGGGSTSGPFFFLSSGMWAARSHFAPSYTMTTAQDFS